MNIVRISTKINKYTKISLEKIKKCNKGGGSITYKTSIKVNCHQIYNMGEGHKKGKVLKYIQF